MMMTKSKFAFGAKRDSHYFTNRSIEVSCVISSGASANLSPYDGVCKNGSS
jgi:hypothetical protein